MIVQRVTIVIVGLVIQACLALRGSKREGRELLYGADVVPAGEKEFVVNVLAKRHYLSFTLRHVCTGTLIDPEWVVTSAACKQGVNYHIMINGTPVSVIEEQSYSTVPELWFLRLSQQVQISPVLVNLFDPDLEKDKLETQVAGWSIAGSDIEPVDTMGPMREKVLKIEGCDREFSTETANTGDKYVCAGFGKDEKEWSCTGDIGAPLLDTTGTKLIGVAHFRKYCAESAYHAAFTNIRVAWDMIAKSGEGGALFATPIPTQTPTLPTLLPTLPPSLQTSSPTLSPTLGQTSSPTLAPTVATTFSPTLAPTLSTLSPSTTPTSSPILSTAAPSTVNVGGSTPSPSTVSTTKAPSTVTSGGGSGNVDSPVPSPSDADPNTGSEEDSSSVGPILGVAVGVTGAFGVLAGLFFIARRRQLEGWSHRSGFERMPSQHDSDASGVGPAPFGNSSTMKSGDSSPIPTAQELSPHGGPIAEQNQPGRKAMRSIRQLPLLFNKRISQIV